MSSQQHSRAWYRHKESSGADALLFFLVLAIGVAGIVWLKNWGYHQFVITAFPCALIFAYAGIVKFLPRFRLREDQAGDNCYYLGFLFTLVSLVLALVAFADNGGTEQVVENFGIALATTIVGLACRVAFNQMRQDPVDIEREARLELASAAQRLRAELDQSVVDMNGFRRATQQSIVDGLEEFSDKVAELLEANLARYDEITRGSAERIDQTLKAFAESASRLNENAESTAGAIEELTVRIEAIKAPEDLVETRLAPAADAIADMVEELKKRANAESREFRQLRKVIEAASTSATVLDEKISNIGSVLERLDELGASLDDAGKRVASLAENMNAVGETLVTSSEDWRKSLVAEAQSLQASLVQSSKSMVEAASTLQNVLSDSAAQANSALSSIAGQTESLNEIEARLQRLPTLLDEHAAALERFNRANTESPRSTSPFWRPR